MSYDLRYCMFVVKGCLVGFMVFKATFNNISDILVKETRGPEENRRPVASH